MNTEQKQKDLNEIKKRYIPIGDVIVWKSKTASLFDKKRVLKDSFNATELLKFLEATKELPPNWKEFDYSHLLEEAYKDNLEKKDYLHKQAYVLNFDKLLEALKTKKKIRKSDIYDMLNVEDDGLELKKAKKDLSKLDFDKLLDALKQNKKIRVSDIYDNLSYDDDGLELKKAKKDLSKLDFEKLLTPDQWKETKKTSAKDLWDLIRSSIKNSKLQKLEGPKEDLVKYDKLLENDYKKVNKKDRGLYDHLDRYQSSNNLKKPLKSENMSQEELFKWINKQKNSVRNSNPHSYRAKLMFWAANKEFIIHEKD